jgi:biotin carboxylase
MTAASKSETVLLLGNYRPALTVARSLAAEGHVIWVSRDDDAGAAYASRFVNGLWENPPRMDPAIQYPALAEYLKVRPDITVVFPLLEAYVRGFSAYRSQLPNDRLYVMPNRSAVETCLDKAQLLNLVEKARLPLARNMTVRDLPGLQAAIREVGFPLVVKPTDSTIWLGQRKALIVRDQGAFAAAFPDWPSKHTGLIVQTYIEGPRLNLYFAAQNGRAIRYLPVEIGATDIQDGTGLATHGFSVPLTPQMRAMGDALIELLQYHGIGCIQMLQDRQTGDLSFLEINPRIGGNHAITDHCGMHLDRLALKLAAGTPVDDRLVVGKAGVRYAWTIGALRGAAVELRNGELTGAGFARQIANALRIGLTTRAHITFRFDDPVPSIALLARALPGRRLARLGAP